MPEYVLQEKPTLWLLKKYVLYINVCFVNVIWAYYIVHVVIVMTFSISCIASQPFTTPLPWPHEVAKCSSDAFFRIWPDLVMSSRYILPIVFCLLFSWDVGIIICIDGDGVIRLKTFGQSKQVKPFLGSFTFPSLIIFPQCCC